MAETPYTSSHKPKDSYTITSLCCLLEMHKPTFNAKLELYETRPATTKSAARLRQICHPQAT